MDVDLIIKGGTIWLPDGARKGDVAVVDGRIAAIGAVSSLPSARILNAHGLYVLPGVIDTQVHFREPGLEYKETLATGAQAAVLGGVTAVCEMPNTVPATTSADAFVNKMYLANGRMACDYAFFLGATEDNVDRLAEWEQIQGCAGIKVFMGSSTGTLLIKDENILARVLSAGRRRVAVHCEDEIRLQQRRHLVKGSGLSVTLHPIWRDVNTALIATKHLIRLARVARRMVHVLHVTTSEEVSLLRTQRDIATVEVTPQHLTLVAPTCYEQLGTLAQVNPPIRNIYHFRALWQAVNDGVITCIGSDHAPHTLKEKARPYPLSPSGMPGVQTLVPVMLTHVAAGRLSLARFVDLTSAGPAFLYGISNKGHIAVGYDADFTIVDLKAHRVITRNWLVSKCGWSPFEGMLATGWPVITVVRGHVAMYEGTLSSISCGRSLRFHNS